MIQKIQDERAKITSILKSIDPLSLNNPKVQDMFRNYEEHREMLDTNPTVNKFLGSSFSVQNFDGKVLATDFLREFTFGETIVKAYASVVDNPSPEAYEDFYKTYQNLHKDCFEQDVDFTDQIRQLHNIMDDHPKSHNLASYPAMTMSPERPSKSEIQEQKKEEAKISHFGANNQPSVDALHLPENNYAQNSNSFRQRQSFELQKNAIRESVVSQQSNPPIVIVNEGLRKTATPGSNVKVNNHRVYTEYDDINEYNSPPRPKAETYGTKPESVPDIPLVG
jgi:hypothetical protein